MQLRESTAENHLIRQKIGKWQIKHLQKTCNMRIFEINYGNL